jgi:molybdopterin-guanine dinucleotide biosynthesis protein A
MGTHKPGIPMGGRPIVERVLEAVAGLAAVVVGSGDGVPTGTLVVSEDPPGGGPVAGIAAGWAAIQEVPYAAGLAPSAPDVVVVLAGDLPLLTAGHVEALVEAVRSADPGERVAVTVSTSGPNWLCAAWPSRLLAARLAAVGDPSGVSVRRLLEGVPRVEIDDAADVAVDVDTPAELEAARRRLDEG